MMGLNGRVWKSEVRNQKLEWTDLPEFDPDNYRDGRVFGRENTKVIRI